MESISESAHYGLHASYSTTPHNWHDHMKVESIMTCSHRKPSKKSNKRTSPTQMFKVSFSMRIFRIGLSSRDFTILPAR